MKVNGYVINTMFVERSEAGIDLYGAYLERNNGPLVVVRSTKNMQDLAPQLYGPEYTNDRFIEKLKNRPTHNFIGNLSGPISMPIDMSTVSFVD